VRHEEGTFLVLVDNQDFDREKVDFDIVGLQGARMEAEPHERNKLDLALVDKPAGSDNEAVELVVLAEQERQGNPVATCSLVVDMCPFVLDRTFHLVLDTQISLAAEFLSFSNYRFPLFHRLNNENCFFPPLVLLLLFLDSLNEKFFFGSIV